MVHPRALAMILCPLALGAAYFFAAAPANAPGAYVFTPDRQAHALPARLDGDLPAHRPEYFYLFDPDRYAPPLDPSTARLSLVTLPRSAAPGARPAGGIPLEVTIAPVNPHLYSIRSVQLDGPWVREQAGRLLAGAPPGTRPALILTAATADRRSVVRFGLAVERLW
ncbi:MAG: hypothetical protein IT176_00905 [Acidobacteria bacterium]|nr:hypothetical protein [Acidobacteriota bacterium]